MNEPDTDRVRNANTAADDMLVILPVRNLVLFPGTVVPVAINRDRSLAAAQEAVRNERKVGFLLQHDPETAGPDRQTICTRSARSPTSCAM